ESVTGDVALTVTNGSFDNVLPVTEDTGSRSGDDLVAKWIAMGLINADGSDNGAAVKARAMADYENGVKTEFANYAAQKAIYDANPTMVKTDAYNTLDSKYAAYATADAFLSAKSADSSSDYYKISHELYGWSKDSLLYALQKSIINPTSGSSQTLVRPANVKGKNITLTALNGGIGKDEAAEVLSIVNLGSNLTTLKKLAGAEASDVTWDEAGGSATIKRTTAIGIEMTDANGALNATAKNNIYLAAATDAPVYLNNINAGTSNIRLLGKSGVYNVSTVPNAVNFKGRDLIVEGGSNGNNSFLGTDVKPLVVDLSGKLTARADGLINIFQTGLNAMQISALFGGSDVMLRSAKDLLSVNTGITAEDLGYINAGGKLTLLSETGNIGEDGKGVRILGDNTDSVAAEGENVYIAAESESSSKPAINLGDVTARNAAGVIKITNNDSGVNFDGNVNAHTVSVTADSLTQNESSSYVKATSLSAVTKNGLALDSLNNEIAQAALTNSTVGNIELNNKIALTLNGVTNSAVAGNVTINNAAAVTTAQGISAMGNLSVDAVGAFQTTAAVAAGNDVSIESDYGIALNTVSAGNNVTLAAGVGAITASTIDAGQNVTITDAEGDITVNSVSADNDLFITATKGNTSVTTAEAGNNMTLAAGIGNIDLTDAVAGNDLTLNTGAGNITLARGTATNGDSLLKTSAGTIIISDKLKSALTTIVEATLGITSQTIESGDKATVKNVNGLIDIE
ncbi:MAG: adhesin HecA family, partial [uncultured bacterium]